MTASENEPRAARRRRAALWIALGLVALLAVIAVAVAIGAGGRPGQNFTGGPSAVATASGSPTPTPRPPVETGAPSPAPSEEPAPEVQAPIDEPAMVGGLEVSIAAIEAVEGTADEPGEIGGPAIRVTVAFSNATDETISLRETVVTVDSGPERTPAPELDERNGPGLPNDLPAGAEAQGVYVFTLADADRDDVRITVFTSVAAPNVVFSGAVPR